MSTEAERELDALVAEKVMGVEPRLSWNVLNADETASAYRGDSMFECAQFLASKLKAMPDSWLKDYHVGSWKIYERYSTNIAVAWEVVAKMRERGFWLKLCTHWQGNELVSAGFTEFETVHCGSGWVAAESESAAHAICLAALKAIEPVGLVEKV